MSDDDSDLDPTLILGIMLGWVGCALTPIIHAVFICACANFAWNAPTEDDPDEERTHLCRLTSMHWGVYIWIWIIVVVVTFVQYESADRIFGVAASGAIVVLAFVVIVTESRFCWERRYLKGQNINSTCVDYLNGLVLAKPEVSIDLDCYRMVDTRIYFTDREGWSQYSHTEKNKKSEYKTTRVFNFRRFTDMSENFRNFSLLPNRVTALRLNKRIRLGDQQTKTAYSSLEDEMRDSAAASLNRSPENCDFKMITSIPRFQPFVLSGYSSGRRPCWMNGAMFWLATCLLIGWPYRFLFKRSIQKCSVTIDKDIFLW